MYAKAEILKYMAYLGDLVGVDGYVIALGRCQDMSYYVSGLELL